MSRNSKKSIGHVREITRYMVFLETEPGKRLGVDALRDAITQAYPEAEPTFVAEVTKDGMIVSAYELTVFRLGHKEG